MKDTIEIRHGEMLKEMQDEIAAELCKQDVKPGVADFIAKLYIKVVRVELRLNAHERHMN